MISAFGTYIRKIRKEKNESLRTMASKLGIAASFLSEMEVGKKPVPTEYGKTISEMYQLNGEESQMLENSIIETNESLDIDVEENNESRIETSLVFTRRIKNVDNDLVKKLMDVLNDDKD